MGNPIVHFEIRSDDPVGQRVARVPIAQEFGDARVRIGVERHQFLDAGGMLLRRQDGFLRVNWLVHVDRFVRRGKASDRQNSRKGGRAANLRLAPSRSSPTRS